MAENFEKFRSTELYGAALEGLTTFLCRSFLGCTSMESCQLADLKYALFSSTGIELLIRKGIGLLIRKGIGLLIRKGIELLIIAGIALLLMKGIGLLIMKGRGY